MNSNSYQAPWGKSLCWMSALSVAIMLGMTAPLFFKATPPIVRWLVLLPLLMLPGAALFVIRAYAVEANQLAIQRLLWTTRVPLAGLQSAEAVPNAMRGSLRLCGNGGFFSITGWYRSRALGNYRAFVTDLKRTVVLRFPARAVVISPENPERFVAEISTFVNRSS